MKQLRILTGIHAGATAALGPGRHRIDADDDADIRITDWTGPSAIVEVSDTDVVTVRLLAVHEAATAAECDEGVLQETQASDDRIEDIASIFMLDFVPMQFDQSVICIGPDDIDWPSDLELLSTLLKPGQAADDTRDNARSRIQIIVALGAACVVLAAIASVSALSMTTRTNAPSLPNDVATTELINREFSAARLPELHASLDGHGGVLVRGFVANESENLATRRLLDAVPSPHVQAQYGIVEVIRRSIGEGLPIEGISVRYDGGGVFSITGKNVDMDALQQGVKRIRPDLPADVKDIRIEATGAEQADAPVGASYIAIVSSDTVRYAQTPDGVKHIFILDGDAPASDANVAASVDAATPASSTHTLDQPQAPVMQTADTLRR